MDVLTESKYEKQSLNDNASSVSSHCFNGFFSIFKRIPKGIFPISLFGLFLGMSTTMVYSQLSLFLKNDLGLSIHQITNLDGMVESISFVTRVFAGPISDFFRERKLLLMIGCLITLGARSFLPVIKGFVSALIAQLCERVGNGMQATPRDALIADLTPRHLRCQTFGFTRSVKTIGGLLGGVIAVTLIGCFSGNFRDVFKCAIIPVIIAAICLFFVKTKHITNVEHSEKRDNPFRRKYLRSLDFSFWKLMILALVFQLGHFTEHLFPIYMEHFVNARVACTVGTIVNLGQICLAFTIGICADKFGKGRFIRVCMSLMFVADILFLIADYMPNVVFDIFKVFGDDFIVNMSACCIYIGAFLWGGQLAAIEGLFITIISEQVAFRLRATAIGIYSLLLGLGYWIASNFGGAIWENFGYKYTFFYSLCFACIAFLLSFILLPKKYNVCQGYQEVR